jgi:hypothetical protein
MSEDQIERAVERKVDQLDQRYQTGQIDERQYDAEMKKIDLWANSMYRKVQY